MLDNIIEVYGKRMLLLKVAIEKNVLPDPNESDLWVVNHPDAKLVKKFLIKVNRSENINIYLKPIFLQKELKKGYNQNAELLKHFSDGYIKGLSFIDKIPNIEFINNFIINQKFNLNKFEKSSDEYFLYKSLVYYYTRKKEVVPIVNRKALTGYSYPKIESLFENKTTAFIKSRALLAEAYVNEIFSRNYVDTSHLCKNCYSGFLNFREICPKCSTHNLKMRNLIHHFRCAYVGIDKDFFIKDKMVCPKCTSEIKNVGVEYDKPGKIFICRNKKCNHEFQDPPIGVHCVDCRTEQSPEDLVVRKIYSYELTNKGNEKILDLC